MKKLGQWIDHLFNKHMLVRRTLVFWAVVLITWVIYQVFIDVSKITAAVGVALGTVTAILSVVVTHYQYSRSKDNANVDNS